MPTATCKKKNAADNVRDDEQSEVSNWVADFSSSEIGNWVADFSSSEVGNWVADFSSLEVGDRCRFQDFFCTVIADVENQIIN